MLNGLRALNGLSGLRSRSGSQVRSVDISGAELVTNGKFPTDLTGWTDGSSAGGAISWVAGKMRATNTTGTARGQQSVAVTSGQRYAFFAQNTGTVAGSVALSSSGFGASEYLNFATNGAIAAQAGVTEFTATTATTFIQLGQGVVGSSNWDNVSLRKLTPTVFSTGRVFSDDFSVKPDGPLDTTPDGLLWRNMAPQNGVHVYPYIASGKLAVTASGDASGTTASYPYLNFGTGKVASIYCDIQWPASGSIAMISVQPTGTLLTVSNITTNSLHIVFTDTKVDITTYVSSAATTESVNYGAACVLDGRTYANVGWSLNGSTLVIRLPGGTSITRTDSKFSQVQGSCGVVEHFYQTATPGPVTVSKVSMGLG